jgi:hypothetical protein
VALKALIVFGGIVLLAAMILDRITGRRSARVVLILLVVLVGGVAVVGQLVSLGIGPAGPSQGG